MAKVRVISEGCAVRLPGGDGMVALIPDKQYDSNDPLVKAYPWAFGEDNARSVEQASANPGQFRNNRR